MICARTVARLTAVLPLALLLLPAPSLAQSVERTPSVILGGIPFTVGVRGADEGSTFWSIHDATGTTLASGTVAAGQSADVSGARVESADALPVTVTVGSASRTFAPAFVPGWFSLAPPIIAILLALIFREVVSALFAGIWLGALAIAGFNPLAATARVVDTFIVPELGDTSGQTQIVVFTLLLGGMVGVISRNGGTLGIVEALRPMATSRRRGKLATWAAGLAIFFDDYANTLIVGNTMRPITDRLRISREKLAYLVDSTAAPVAAIVPISTWAGYEISLIQTGLRTAAEQQAANPALADSLLQAQPFAVFVHSIPYLFYPLLALVLVFLTSALNRDLGPMAAAEQRAAAGEGLYRPGAQLATDVSDTALQPPDEAPRRWLNAALPVLMVILVVVLGLLATGRASAGPDASLRDVFSAADPFSTLLWGSLAGSLTAILLSVGQRILSLRDTVEAWIAGMKAMMIAMVILVLAWSLGGVTEQLGTAQYLSQLLGGALPVELMPALVFIIAAAMAFATGTSWATMAIMLPLVIPLTVAMGGGGGFEQGYSILLGVISSVLAGSIFGDHCSPISDTTVLSSMASASDHVDHVRTQLPYAVLVGVIALLLGDLGTAYGLPNWVALGLGVIILYGVLRVFGTPMPELEREG